MTVNSPPDYILEGRRKRRAAIDRWAGEMEATIERLALDLGDMDHTTSEFDVQSRWRRAWTQTVSGVRRLLKVSDELAEHDPEQADIIVIGALEMLTGADEDLTAVIHARGSEIPVIRAEGRAEMGRHASATRAEAERPPIKRRRAIVAELIANEPRRPKDAGRVAKRIFKALSARLAAEKLKPVKDSAIRTDIIAVDAASANRGFQD